MSGIPPAWLADRLLGWGRLDARMQRELVESYHGQMTPSALFANVLGAAAVLATGWDPAAAPRLIAWFVAVCMVALGNGLKQRAYARSPDRRPPDRWALLFWLGSPVNGIVWGAAMPLFFDPSNFGGSLLLLVLQCGLSAGAVVTMASIPGTAIGFFAPALLFTTATLLWHDTLSLRITGGLTLFYLFVLLQMTAKGHAGLMRSIHLYMENARLSKAKSDFLAVMSHEIRTPMNGMLGAVHLLKSMPLDERARTAVDVAERTGAAMLAIIDDILDFTKITDGKLEIAWAPFDLPALLADVHAIMGLRAEQKGLSLAVAVDPRLPVTVLGDADRLRQILLNLVGNAVKFTDAGAVHLLAAPDLGREDWVCFRVTDTGIGISADRVERVFEPFTQADASITRRFGGTGLGLAICRRLIEAMGGRVGVESQPGRGSTFQVLLPLPPAGAGDVATPGAGREEPSMSSASAVVPRNVLVVDDDENNRFVLSGLLNVMGHRVLEAAEGLEALRRLASQRVDVVLTDLQMPGMDGADLVRRIRALPGRTAAVPVVAVTANVSAGVVELCLEAGMDGYLSKPVMPERLREAIDAVCAGRPLTPIDGEAEEGAFLIELERHLGRETAGRLIGQAVVAVEHGAVELDAAIRSGDREAARRAAHRLAGSAGLAGLVALSTAAAALEDRLIQAEINGIEADVRAALLLAEQSATALRHAHSDVAQNR